MKKRALTIMLAVFVSMAFGFLAREEMEMHKDYSGIRIANSGETAEKLRTGLKHRAYKLRITFRAHTRDEDRIKALVDDLLEKALYESGDPAGGDYIRYQMGGYSMHYEMEKRFLSYQYRMELMPVFYSTAEEEAYVDEQVGKILEDLDAQTLPDEEKVRRVHDYIVSSLSYDKVHKENSQSHAKTTAYAALRFHQVVCQGYAVLCYRLLKELGVSCRIVTGDVCMNGITERHAWLSVRIGEDTLYLDPTLDDVYSCYDWYLKSEEDFAADHRPSQEGS